MKTVILGCTAVDPLVITSGSAESMAHECLGYIPGNMLLGAMAAVWKSRNRGVSADGDPEFQRLFLNGDTLWGHALPVCADGAATPIPASYMYDKSHEALPPEDGDFDPGKYWVANALTLAGASEPPSPWQGQNRAQARLRKVGQGFMDPATLHRMVEHRVFNIHVALGEGRACQEGQLYGYSALARDTRLASHILCRNDATLAALLNLARDVKSLRVGHARSAGYGRINTHWQAAGDATQASAPQKVFLLFLESQFMPLPSWAEAQASLCREIAQLAGHAPRVTGFCGSLEEIQGYNGLWNRPRTSRQCLAMGSVLRIEFDEPVGLPQLFSIGADQVEGYGRIQVNPAFLMESVPVIAPPRPAKPEAKPAPEPQPENLPLWQLVRERIASRQMLEQATLWLNEKPWREFLADVAKLEKPTASQRNNLRDMNLEVFKAMLGKTPGEQWEQAVARSPFTGRKDHLSVIITQLLDPAVFCKKWQFRPVDLPGKVDAAVESQKAQRLFIRQLVSTWNKHSRLSEKE